MKRNYKRIVALLLLVVLAVLPACGKSKDAQEKAKNKAAEKGRFVERIMAMPEGEDYVNSMKKLSDGTIRMAGDKGIYDSADNGETWKKADITSERLEKAGNSDYEQKVYSYTYGIAIGDDGSLFYHYVEYSEEEDKAIESVYEYISADGEVRTVELNLPRLDLTEYYNKYYGDDYLYESMGRSSVEIIGEETDESNSDEGETDPDETQDAENTSLPEEEFDYKDVENELYQVEFTPDGNLLGANSWGNLYYIDINSGEILQEFDGGENVQSFVCIKDKVLVTEWENVTLYNLASGEEEKLDDILLDFLIGPYGYVEGNLQFDMLDDETMLIYKESAGVYSFKFGDDEVKAILDGSKYSLSGSSYYFSTFVALEMDSFLFTCYTDSGMKIFSYTFSEDAEGPSKYLKIFSLTENEQAKQAAMEFQMEHPEYEVTVEYGITWEDDENGRTVSDVISTLNTEILGGNGPDILLLDGLPSDSYIEKGMLADLSDLVDEINQSTPLFENIVKVFETNGSVYAVPSKFMVTLLQGDAALLDGISDLSSLAQTVEQQRAGNETIRTILGNFDFEDLNNFLSVTALPAVMNTDGTINREALTNYIEDLMLIGAKNIKADAEENEYNEWMKEWYEEDNISDISLMSNYVRDLEDGTLYALSNMQMMNMGKISSMNYIDDIWLFESECGWDTQILSASEGKNVFMAKSVYGVNAKSDNVEDAKEFIKYMFSDEQQMRSGWGSGLPVSESAYDKVVERYLDPTDDANDAYESGWSSDELDDEGKMLEVTYTRRRGTQAEYDRFKELIKTLDTADVTNGIIVTTILKETNRALLEIKTVDEAVEDIMDAINLYLAE